MQFYVLNLRTRIDRWCRMKMRLLEVFKDAGPLLLTEDEVKIPVLNISFLRLNAIEGDPVQSHLKALRLGILELQGGGKGLWFGILEDDLRFHKRFWKILKGRMEEEDFMAGRGVHDKTDLLYVNDLLWKYDGEEAWTILKPQDPPRFSSGGYCIGLRGAKLLLAGPLATEPDGMLIRAAAEGTLKMAVHFPHLAVQEMWDDSDKHTTEHTGQLKRWYDTHFWPRFGELYVE